MQKLHFLIFFLLQKFTKSLIVHICKLGVLYHSFGRFSVIGIWPLKRRFNLTLQWPKFGIDTIAFFPTLKSSFITFSGSRKAWSVWLNITKSYEEFGNCRKSFSASPSITVSPFAMHFWILFLEISIAWFKDEGTSKLNSF